MSTAAEIGSTKYCPRCLRDRHTSDFWKNRTTPDGLQSYCKPCLKGAQRVVVPDERSARLRAREERDQLLRTRAEARERENAQRAAEREEKRQESARRREQTEAARAERVLRQQAITEEKRERQAAEQLGNETGIPSDVTECGAAKCSCGKWRKYRCGFPNQGGKCGVGLCDNHGHEIRPGLKYCTPHYERAMEAKARAHR